MNSALLPNISMSQPLLPPTGASTTAGTPNNNNPLGNNNGGGPADRSMEPGSSPLRSSQDKPENGLSINYAGQVRVLSHSHLYGGPVGVPEPRAGDVSTSLDDSRGWGTGTSDDQMSPKEQSSSPDHVPRSINARSEDGDDEAHPMRSSGDSLERLREICDKSLPQHGNTMIDTASNEQIQPDGSTIFHCHLCSYTSPSRDEFNEHVNDHYEFRCPKCDFCTKSEPEWKLHLKEDHNLTPEDLDDDQGIRAPKINSQGKVKVFKCKQCEFVAVTKEDFWRHSKMHIKPEKMLNCPKCPFVTEYKHHLEYHLRNHFGSKPFKCPNCSYTCVNKSMLNSHMKSHTNIYQYRCADCNYATKYCHSLKLHLRKYAHKPAMVLNHDGTPNPLPIIDVYGTRRGPKKKTDADGNPITVPGGANLSPENSLGPLPLPAGMPLTGAPKSPVSPNSGASLSAPRFPVLPPFMLAQMQMQMQQSLNQSSPTRIAQVPPFNHDDYSISPIRRSNERGDSSEMEEDERPRSLNGSENNLKDKFKCAICDFETVSQDIYRNHMVLHATKDQDSPPPTSLPMHLPTPPIALPQYPLQPLQIRSPLAINAEAKAAAAAAAASALFKSGGGPRPDIRSGLFKPFGSRPESGAESPTSSNNVKEEQEKSGGGGGGATTSVSGPAESPSMDYLEYLKKVAPFLKHTMSHPPTSVRSPSGISSTQQTGSSPPLNSTSELISNLYASNFRNMVKSLSSQMPQESRNNSPQQQQHLQQQLFKTGSGSRNPESGSDVQQHKSPKPSGNPPDADSSSGALDLSQLHHSHSVHQNKNDIESPMPSRPQSGSQASTAGSGKSSRRKGKAFKIERKMLTSGSGGATDHDRDSLNSGPSDDLDEVKSDGSSGLSSGKEATTTGNGDHHTVMDPDADFETTGSSGKSVRLSGSHVCKFCEIAFMDSIMYNIHMGYHGFQNPYLCNKCGNEFEEKCAFFLHIGTHSHR